MKIFALIAVASATDIARTMDWFVNNWWEEAVNVWSYAMELEIL